MKHTTRREKLLGEMQQVVPSLAFIALIAPQYPHSGRGDRPPIIVPRVLRMYLLQPWCGVSDEDLVPLT